VAKLTAASDRGDSKASQCQWWRQGQLLSTNGDHINSSLFKLMGK
jgi:hypothetical protein